MKGNCITKMYLSKRNFNFFCQSQKFYQNFYQGVWLLLHYYLTLTKVSQVNNMSKSQCCPLYCHGGGRRALHRWRPH